MNRPSLADTVARYGVDLRRSGRELRAHCPFHDNQSFAFSVNEEKGMFYCFGCGAGGDVIDFIRKLKGLSYREALVELGIDSTLSVRPKKSEALLIEARILATWADLMTRKAEYLLRELGQKIRLARELQDSELVSSFNRQWEILETLAEDLQDKNHVLELYRQRDAIEHLLSDGVVEPWPELPELTPQYRLLLRSLPKPPSEVRQHG